MSAMKQSLPPFKSAEARAKVLGLYEEALGAWPKGPDGSSLERLRVPTSAGETAVFAFGAKSSAKRPLVLLHGTASNSIMWLGEAEILGRERRVYAVDIPGEPGLSEERRLPWEPTAARAWLCELIAGLGFASPAFGESRDFDLLGLSIGGWIALAYATGEAEAIGAGGAALGALALLCPSGIGRTRPSFIWKAMLSMTRGSRGLESIARSLYGDEPPPEGAIAATMLFAGSTNARMEEPRLFLDEELERITAPIFLCVGKKDVMLRSAEAAARLGRLKPEAEIRLLPGAGHALLGQGTAVIEFLDRHQRS